MTDSVLLQAFIYLAAAVVGVPLSRRLGLGSVLGYLVAGVAIGPFALGLVGGEGHHVMHFAEFGVVMMLFLVGLELKPSLLWQMRGPIFGLGAAQVVVSAILLGAGAWLLGVDGRAAMAVGLTLAMSSTAIVLSTLAEKALLKTPGGQASFAVLLFQDVSVIPILAVFPLLAVAAPTLVESTEPTRPGWVQALFIAGAVALVIAAGRFVVRPVLRLVATTRLRELFTAFALFLVVGIALLMLSVGLSPALGTFLAGVVLADSEYRHELEADIEPFKGLLLGLFFISVGADINFALLRENPLGIFAIVLGTMALKFGVLFGLGRAWKLDRAAQWLFAFALCQVGEFAFVLLSLAAQTGVMPLSVTGPLVAATAFSMLLTPPSLIVLERFVLPRVTAKSAERAHDDIGHQDNPVVLAGFGRVGQVVGRMLRLQNIGVTVLDLDPSMVDLLRRLGQQVHYGDASRLDLLHAAGCDKAKLFILAIDEPDKSVEVAELVRRHFPKLPIMARARNRQHYYRLKRLGIDVIHRETMGSSEELAVDAMKHLGLRAHTAVRFARTWRDHDEATLERIGRLQGQPTDVFFTEARKAMDDAEGAMREEYAQVLGRDPDAGWDNEALRAGVKAASSPKS